MEWRRGGGSDSGHAVEHQLRCEGLRQLVRHLSRTFLAHLSDLTHEVGHMAREPVYEALRRQSFTHGLNADQLTKLATLAAEVPFQEDQIIFRAGERSDHLYLLVSGYVCVEIRTPVYSICVQALGPGAAF